MQTSKQIRLRFTRMAALLLALLFAVALFTGCAAQEAAGSAAGSQTASSSPAETPILSAEQPQRAEETPMGEAGTWTIFLYMCGSDLESDGGMASLNLLQIMKAVPSDQVNIIVQTGGSEAWGLQVDEEMKESMEALDIAEMDSSLIDVSADVLQRYRVTDHMELLEELPSASMGAEDTFYDFLKWGVENYPAEHMGVLLWDHGGSGTGGVCVDRLYEDDSLLPFEMNEALQRLSPDMTDRFEFIGFDACLMSAVEVANAISPFARYMYASEETIPGYGWAYIEIIDALNADPTQNGETLGKVICDSYRGLYSKVDELSDGSMVDACTLSVTDLEKMDGVTDALDALGNKLVGALNRPEELKKVTEAALHTESFAYPFMLDMGSWAENLETVYPKEAKALGNALKEAVIYSTHGSYSADSTGMAIFYPRSAVLFTSGEMLMAQLMARYALCAPSEPYYEFVREMQFTQYRAMMSSVPGVHVLEEPHLESVDETTADYTMVLDPADLDKVAEMSYQIWMLKEIEVNGETMQAGILLGTRPGLRYDEITGEVSSDFDDCWKWVTLNGVPLELNLQKYNEEEVVYCAPILLNGNHTNLIIRWEKATDSYELVGTYTGFDAETGELSRKVYALHDGDVIIPRYEFSSQFLIQNGAMEYQGLGMGLSSYENTIPEYATTYDQDNTRLEYTVLEDGDYYFQYYLTDIYGSRQAFAPLEFTMQDGEAYVEMPEEEEGSDASGNAAA